MLNPGEHISETGETRVIIHRAKEDGKTVLADISEWEDGEYIPYRTGIYSAEYIASLLHDEEDPEDVPTFTFTPDWE
jgi:hypothetical protein|tara:strand:+ start:1687 stop:1917 length:231 start_codon:yes stop_codon:yes gene_type:complete